MESKRKHLEMIQGVINRMGTSSFLIKGWSATLATGIVALSREAKRPAPVIAIAVVPVLVFWVLDAYFLFQERLFRALYDHVRSNEENQIDFSMDTSRFNGGRNTWWSSAFSESLVIFNVALLFTVVVAVLVLAAVGMTKP